MVSVCGVHTVLVTWSGWHFGVLPVCSRGIVDYPFCFRAGLACRAAIAAAAIGGGYACWGYGILHGSMERLAIASYATPVLSTGASAVLLGLALSLPFWCGALLVAAGSVLNYLVSARRSDPTT